MGREEDVMGREEDTLGREDVLSILTLEGCGSEADAELSDKGRLSVCESGLGRTGALDAVDANKLRQYGKEFR